MVEIPGIPLVLTVIFVICPASGERKTAFTKTESVMLQTLIVSQLFKPVTIGGILDVAQVLK